MSSRRCSCCLQTGHNILRCNDENAHSILNRILNSDMDTAVLLVNTIPNNLVSFMLVRGYRLSVKSSRNELRSRVIQEYSYRIPRPIVNRAPLTLVPSTMVPPTNIPPTPTLVHPTLVHPNILHPAVVTHGMGDALSIATLHMRTSQLVHNYYVTNPQPPARMSIYLLLVSGYLRRLEHAARGQSVIDFNRYINMRLCISMATACESLRQILMDDEIRHIDNMARMYNYERLLDNSNTFEMFWPARIAEAMNPAQMKVLAIKITVCEPCQSEDTCGVCFDELPSEKMVKTGCGHVYCSTCIAGVAHQRGIKSFIPCPGCRADIVELKVYNEEEHQLVVDGLKPV